MTTSIEVPITGLHFATGQVGDATALVLTYHYSHRMPSNVGFVGTLHVRGGLFGDLGEAICAAIFCEPSARMWSGSVLELTRLVRRDDCGFPLSYLIKLCCKQLRAKEINLLVSYADQQQGHHGGIYQACSWNYDGQRESSNDGLIVHGRFIPGRTCNSLFGTRSVAKLKSLKPGLDVLPHYDEGKHLYWKALTRSGDRHAKELGLKKMAYPKPTLPLSAAPNNRG